MDTLIETRREVDRTVDALVYDAERTGDWTFVEHFMLGNRGNALPMDDK